MEITKSDIIKLIEEQRPDSFSTHFLTVLKRAYRPVGEIKKREIKVWRQSGWNSFFYPIFKFDLNKEGHLENISDKINPVGRMIFILLCALFSIPWLYWVVDDFYITDHWPQIIAWVVFLSIFIFIGLKVYRMEKQIQLNQIYELLDIEINKNPTKEWSFGKTLTRLIMYPLSIFLIIASTVLLIPRGEFLAGIVVLGLVGAYLYTDIKILARKKRKEQAPNPFPNKRLNP